MQFIETFCYPTHRSGGPKLLNLLKLRLLNLGPTEVRATTFGELTFDKLVYVPTRLAKYFLFPHPCEP